MANAERSMIAMEMMIQAEDSNATLDFMERKNAPEWWKWRTQYTHIAIHVKQVEYVHFERSRCARIVTKKPEHEFEYISLFVRELCTTAHWESYGLT